MGDLDLGADGALTLGQLLLEIGEGSVFDHRDEIRRAKHRQTAAFLAEINGAAAERGSGHVFRDNFLDGKSISDFHLKKLLYDITWQL